MLNQINQIQADVRLLTENHHDMDASSVCCECAIITRDIALARLRISGCIGESGKDIQQAYMRLESLDNEVSDLIEYHKRRSTQF